MIHHALYDGWTIPLLTHQVEAAYQHQTLSLRPFSPFVKYLTSLSTPATHSYWLSALQNPPTTHFPPLSPSYIPNPAAILDRTISTPTPFPLAPASALKLAWALTLAHYTSSSDVVFQICSWGRDAPIQGIEHIAGPALCEYPFRFTIPPRATLSELMAQVTEQAAQLIPYQNFGLSNIAAVSKDAERACGVSNQLIIHPPMDEGRRAKVMTELGPRRREGEAIEAIGVVLECGLGEGVVEAHLEYDESLVSGEMAEEIMGRFERVLGVLREGDVEKEVVIEGFLE